MNEGDASIRIRTQALRAADPARGQVAHATRQAGRTDQPCSVHPLRSADLGTADDSPRADPNCRTEQSLRAEEAHQDLQSLAPSQRPLSLARVALASAFDGIMHGHWLRGEAAYSNVAVSRVCGVDEKTVRQWRANEKPLPWAAAIVIQSQLRFDVERQIDEVRGKTPRRALTQLREALEALETQLAHEDAREVGRALDDAQEQLFRLARKVREAGK